MFLKKVLTHYLPPENQPKNDPELNLTHDGFTVIVGKTGSGKTTLLVDLIVQGALNFSKLYINAKNLQEPIYEGLMRFIVDVEERVGKQILFVNSEDDGVVSVDDLDPNESNLVIFDDWISVAGKKALKKVEEYATRGRKQHCMTFYLSQNFSPISRIIRSNSIYYWIGQITQPSAMKYIQREVADDITWEEFLGLYKYATQNQGFLVIDLKTTDASKKYRKGFDEYLKQGG
jgi:energy-coupling factor transporter ATP-binding protein EcfA2